MTRTIGAGLATFLLSLGLFACSSDPELIIGTLEVTDLTVGTGPTAALDDSVRVYYVLSRTDDDRVCDSRVPNSGGSQTNPPLALRLRIAIPDSIDGQIEGFARGLVGAQEGGRRRIVVPPNLGYGLDPPPQQTCIRENEFLDFTIDLIEVIKR